MHFHTRSLILHLTLNFSSNVPDFTSDFPPPLPPSVPPSCLFWVLLTFSVKNKQGKQRRVLIASLRIPWGLFLNIWANGLCVWRLGDESHHILSHPNGPNVYCSIWLFKRPPLYCLHLRFVSCGRRRKESHEQATKIICQVGWRNTFSLYR